VAGAFDARSIETSWASTRKRWNRCKNFFALGMCYWLKTLERAPERRWNEEKFKNKTLLWEAKTNSREGGLFLLRSHGSVQISDEIRRRNSTPGLLSKP